MQNQNPNLPSGISVYDDTFCLNDNAVCYKDIPGVHRALSNFNLNDYIKPDNDDEEKSDEVYLTPEYIDKLVPGMWLKCLYDADDTILYEAMYLTSSADQISPDVEGYNNPSSIGIEYHREGLDDGDDAQKWVPISWCIPDTVHINQCDIHQDSSDSTCDYLALNDSVEALFRRAFKDITLLKKQQSKESCSESSTNEKVLFTYSQHGGDVYKDENTGYLEMGRDDLALPAEMDTSSYGTIYSALVFSHSAVQQVDNKLKLFQLYKDDPLASKVFPKSYSSYVDALQDSEEGGEDIFYVKKARGARGEDIYIKTRDELAADYQELKEEGEYDLVSGGEGDIIDEGDVIIQRAVTDLYTLDGDGPISGARFDIRYYVLITNGKVYLHSNMVFKWTLGVKYDPNDTDISNQLLHSYFGKPGIRPVSIETPLEDKHGNKWNNSERKRRRSSVSGSNREEFKKSDIHGWRDAVADALDDASGVFKNLKELTKSDPTKYVLAGGDAMIKEDGSAVIVEFNVWPDLAGPYKRLTKCLSGEKCNRLFLQTGESADNYIVTESTAAAEIVLSEATAEVMRDMILMVMKVQPADEIEGLREIRSRSTNE